MQLAKTTSTAQLAWEVNRLHEEIVSLMVSSVNKAIKAGEILVQLKQRIGHGRWRVWVEEHLNFSYRTARRYQHIFLNREKIGKEVKTMRQAERAMAKTAKATFGQESVEADYSRIDRDLIAPIRLVRRRLKRVTYKGDTPETIDLIFENLTIEVIALLQDLS